MYRIIFLFLCFLLAIISPRIFAQQAYKYFIDDRIVSNAGIQLDESDHLGRSVVTGNFDGDRFPDLAVSIPNYDSMGIFNTGAVLIYWGTSQSHFNYDEPTLLNKTHCGDRVERVQTMEAFGFSMAVGDINLDQRDDLVIGIPYNDAPGPIQDSGAICVLYGNANRRNIRDGSRLMRRSDLQFMPVQSRALFGWSVAVGHVFDNRDARDIIVGSPFANTPSSNRAGEVVVIDGQDDQQGEILNGEHCEADGSQTGAQFGFSVAVGNYTDNTITQDIAVGSPFWADEKNDSAGRVYTFDDGQHDQCLPIDLIDLDEQKSDNKLLTYENARMGYSLAFGNFDQFGVDEKNDLAIGIPGYHSKTQNGALLQDAGAVSVVYGNNNRLRLSDSGNFSMDLVEHRYFLKQLRLLSPTFTHQFENLGEYIATGDVNNDGLDDLLISVYKHNVSDKMPSWAVGEDYFGPYASELIDDAGGLVVTLGINNDGVVDSSNYSHPSNPGHNYVKTRINLFTERDLRIDPQAKSFGPTAMAVVQTNGENLIVAGKPQWNGKQGDEGMVEIFQPRQIPIVGSTYMNMADSVAIIDLDSGNIIATRNPYYLHSPHSMTKVMTGILVDEAINAGMFDDNALRNFALDNFTFLQKEINPGNGKSPAHFIGNTNQIDPEINSNSARHGEKTRVKDFMAQMLLPSGNATFFNLAFLVGNNGQSPTSTIAEAQSWYNYVTAANAKAADFGMIDTSFEWGFGNKSRGGTTTTWDFALLLKRAIDNGYLRDHYLRKNAIKVSYWLTTSGDEKKDADNGIVYHKPWSRGDSGAYWCTTLALQFEDFDPCNQDVSKNISQVYPGMVSLGGKTGTWPDEFDNANANLMMGFRDTRTDEKVGIVIMGAGSGGGRHNQVAAMARWALDMMSAGLL